MLPNKLGKKSDQRGSINIDRGDGRLGLLGKLDEARGARQSGERLGFQACDCDMPATDRGEESSLLSQLTT